MRRKAGDAVNMEGNRFSAAPLLSCGRLQVFRSESGLMLKYAAGMIAILLPRIVVEINVSRSERPLGTLLREFGIGVSIGYDERYPPCADVRVLLGWKSWLLRLLPEWTLADTTMLHLVPREVVASFDDVDEQQTVMVSPRVVVRTYKLLFFSPRYDVELEGLIDSRLDVIDRVLRCSAKLDTVRIKLDSKLYVRGGMRSEYIGLKLREMLTFPSRRIFLMKKS